MSSSVGPLTAAANALKSAKSFTGSVDKQSGHSYSNAPYAMAHKAAESAAKSSADSGNKPAGLSKEVSDVASGIKWRQEQAKAVDQ